MAKMKIGTPTGYYDKDNNPVLVGDRIKVNGDTYEISQYGSALHLPDREAFPLSKMVRRDIEVLTPPPIAEPEKKTEDKKPLPLNIDEAQKMSDIPDIALAEELRRRGYEVTAKKVTVIEL